MSYSFVGFSVIFHDRRVGTVQLVLYPEQQRAGGYFQPDGEVNPAEIERGLVTLESLDGELVARNVWLKLVEERGAIEADAEIRSPEFWAAAAGR